MLMKHTAWMNTRLIERGPRPEDERYVPLAVRMLTLVGCLNYAMLDLESELTASGLFRHETKRRYTQARTLVAQAHGIAWSMLRKIDHPVVLLRLQCYQVEVQLVGDTVNILIGQWMLPTRIAEHGGKVLGNMLAHPQQRRKAVLTS